MTLGRDNAVALACTVAVAVMVGVSYAAVPLYQMFCQATGFGGTTQRAISPSTKVLERPITVRFDANVSPALKWMFEPVQRTVKTKVGENVLAFYRATNNSDHAITGTASFNVAPDVAGKHFSKIECFCFKEQTLQPGETVEMPVSFFVDAALVKDPDAAYVQEITLSYTFYESGAKAAGVTKTGTTAPEG